MIIRHGFKPTDIGQIVLLHGALYSSVYGYDHTFEAYVAEPLAQFVLRNSDPSTRVTGEKAWLVEDEQGQILGSVFICQCDQGTAQLRWFIVSSKAQGMGLGKRLLNEALAFCQQQGYETVKLWTVDGLESAKYLYSSFGFKLIEERTHQIWGAQRTECCYEKHLV